MSGQEGIVKELGLQVLVKRVVSQKAVASQLVVTRPQFSCMCHDQVSLQADKVKIKT